MASTALGALLTALPEISDLIVPIDAISTLGTKSKQMRVAGRAQTVLLCSHFERYFYQINEEAVAFVNTAKVTASDLPLPMKLLHSKEPLEQLSATAWENRSAQLTGLIASDSWLWAPGETGNLLHSRMLAWMTSPKPKNLVRYYKYWEIEDIFTAVTRKAQTRNRLWLGVQELVEKRNSIAHGDYSAQATESDVRRFEQSVTAFCERADRKLAKALASMVGANRPW